MAHDQRLASVAIFQVSGRRDADDVAASVANAHRADYIVVPFCDDMVSFYTACDLAVTRAGALSVGELAATGTPAVLVPLPGAPGDHQTKNAELLVKGGAGVLLSDDALSASSLADTVLEILGDPSRRAAMSAAGFALAHHDAAGEVAEVVLNHAR
jgi:UDP-N-acetylglucosamine--N-acetylmuramyl-(pentapeptide) pyrophosphoryl-undecaprenol N-acetylglucosamine transferase